MTTKTNLKNRILSLLLALVMIAGLIPFTTLTANAWSLSTPQYITDIGIAYANKKVGESGNDAANRAKKLLTDNGYTAIDQDLNEDASGAYIYTGYKTSTDYSRAITGIFFWVGNKDNKPDRYQKDSTWFYLVGGSYESNGTGDGAVDLNEGAGGKYIYLYITRDTTYNGGYPLMEICYKYHNMAVDSYKVAQNFNGSSQNLNEGAKSSSKSIYLNYKTFADYTQRDEDKHITYTTTLNITFKYLDAGGKLQSASKTKTVRNHEEKFTVSAADVPQTVTVNGYTLSFAGWRSDYNGYDPQTSEFSTTFMDGTGHSTKAKTAYAVYSGNVTVRYDANGGTGAPAAQTLTVKARAYASGTMNGTATFTLSSSAPVNSSLHDFLGWSTDKNATTAQYKAGQQVEFRKDTTLYAVYATHPYSDKWTSNSTHHWRNSTCNHNATTDYGAHDFNDATCTQPKTCKVCGYQTGSALGHNCKYSVNGNVITQTCTRCSHSETATITLSGSRRYTGSALEPCTVVYSSGWYGAKNYELKYENNVNVGTATCYIQQNSVYAYLTFTIEKGVFSGIWASGENVTYDGKEHCITVHGVPEGAKVFYQSSKYPWGWYTGGRYNYIGPDVGSYRVSYKVVKDSYEELVGYAYVTISRATNEWITEPGIVGWTYGETASTPDTGSVKFGTVKVAYKPADADDSAYSQTVPTQAGDYIIRFSVDGTGNYSGLSVERKFTIKQVPLTVTADDQSKIYGESDPELTWKLTDGKLVDGDVLEINVTRTPGEDADTYTITAGQAEGANANYAITFKPGTLTIDIASQSAPVGLVGTPEDVEGRANGTITGVDTTMEYRREGETDYSAITGTELTDLAEGVYFIRYRADGNHYASPDTQIVLGRGEKLRLTLPATQVGYSLTVGETELAWNGSTTLAFALQPGYSALDGFAVKVNDEAVELDESGGCTISNVQSNLTITVEGVADITAPDTQIILGENSWGKFLNSISFGLFFKNTQSVTVSATDEGSGLAQICWYASATALTEEDVLALTDSDWTTYEDGFSIDPERACIIYVKATDRAGNTRYVSSDGIVLDSIAPVISGVADGETHYGDTTFTVEEENLDVVKLDGEGVTLTDGAYTIIADGKAHTITAIDRAGNESAPITVTVITIESLDNSIEGITVDNVKSSDKEAIEAVQTIVDTLLDSGKDFTDEEKQLLADMKDNTDTLLKKIEEISGEIADITTAVNGYDIDNVKSDDRQDIQELINQIEVLAAGDNLTEEEKSELDSLKDKAEELLDRIDETAQKVSDSTEKVNNYDPEQVTADDKQDISDLITEIDKLLGDENLTESEKEALSEAKDNAQSLLDKIEGSASPTGDDAMIGLWFTLLLVSGGLLAMNAYRKKGKYSA